MVSPASGDGDKEYQDGLDALSSLISGRARADGKNWSHAFEMMQVYLEVRPRRHPTAHPSPDTPDGTLSHCCA